MPSENPVEIEIVDFQNTEHLQAVIAMLDYYAQTPSGGNQSLPTKTKQKLQQDLPQVPGALSVLAWHSGKVVGLLNAFSGYSTFAASPLLNIHDVVVDENHRNRGIARQLLKAAESVALERGHCKLTLEVLSQNHAAKASYQGFGFTRYDLGETFGGAEFWQKAL